MAPNGKKRADQKEISQHQYTLSTVENLFVANALQLLEIETKLLKYKKKCYVITSIFCCCKFCEVDENCFSEVTLKALAEQL